MGGKRIIPRFLAKGRKDWGGGKQLSDCDLSSCYALLRGERIGVEGNGVDQQTAILEQSTC